MVADSVAGRANLGLGLRGRLHGSPGEMDEGLFRKVLLGISCRDYEAAVEAVPGAIGLSKSTVSREFKKATAAKLKEFQERDLSGYDVVALVLDGKSFAEDEMVVALGVTTKGGQGLPRVRPDRHGERRGDPILPSESEGPRSRPVGRSARGDRWSPAVSGVASWRSSRDRCSSSGANGTSGRT